jgi:hypothetical protein
MTPEHEIVELGLKLYNASCKFVERRIESHTNTSYFIDGAWTVSRAINEKQSLTEIIEILTNLKGCELIRKQGSSFFFNPVKYRVLAVDVALDIFTSMQRRYRGQHEDSTSRTFTVVF